MSLLSDNAEGWIENWLMFIDLAHERRIPWDGVRLRREQETAVFLKPTCRHVRHIRPEAHELAQSVSTFAPSAWFMPYQQAFDAVSRTENQTINVRIRSPILDDAIDEFTVVSTEARQVKILRLAEKKSGCSIGKPASHIAEPTMFLLIVVRVHDVRSGLAEVIEHPERVFDRVLQIIVEVDDKLSPGVAETFQHRRMLPEVSRHVNKGHRSWHRGNKRLCTGIRIILTSVIHTDELIASRN